MTRRRAINRLAWVAGGLVLMATAGVLVGSWL